MTYSAKTLMPSRASDGGNLSKHSNASTLEYTDQTQAWQILSKFLIADRFAYIKHIVTLKLLAIKNGTWKELV